MFVCLVNQFRNVLKESILKMKLPPQFVQFLRNCLFAYGEKVAILPKNLRKISSR